MEILSPAFKNNTSIPSLYTCDGVGVNPPLKFGGVPDTARSLVLIVDDPDAPRGTWTHWIVWNMSPMTTEIAENSVSNGAIEGITSYGKPGWGVPCPPSGTHRYFFKLYALDIILSLGSSVEAVALEQAMVGHIIESAEIVGLYSRK